MKFKIGDTVMITKPVFVAGNNYEGKIGTIYEMGSLSYEYPISVKFDNLPPIGSNSEELVTVEDPNDILKEIL